MQILAQKLSTQKFPFASMYIEIMLFSPYKRILNSIQKIETASKIHCSLGLFCTSEFCQNLPGTQARHV